MAVKIHPTAAVDSRAGIGEGSQIWHNVQVREHAIIGRECIIGQGAYIDASVTIGDQCKVQNYACIYTGVTLEDGVFVGPHATFTNDKSPRAIRSDGALKSQEDWTITKTLVKRGAAIGANATVVCGVTIGEWSMVAAGAVVTRDVPPHGLVRGSPARLVGFVGSAGFKMNVVKADGDRITLRCEKTGETIEVDAKLYATVDQ